MPMHPDIQLSRLRQIGWSLWDPIGLRNDDGSWDVACADEYDSYLLHVAFLLCDGEPIDKGRDYLVKIVSEHMGFSLIEVDDAAKAAATIAAEKTTAAIARCVSSLS